MGMAQRYYEELQELGMSSVPAGAACGECVADEALRVFLIRSADSERCSFCSCSSPSLNLEELFRYMGSCIQSEWEDPIEEVGWEHGYTLPVFDTWDLLMEFDDPFENDGLRNAFLETFQGQWVQRSPYRLDYADEMRVSWEQFAGLVKKRRRSLFLLDKETKDEELKPASEMLQAIGQAVDNAAWKVLTEVDQGEVMYRSRTHLSGVALPPRTEDDLGAPPPKWASANRFSPAGVPMFYAASDKQTAEAEVRPAGLEAVTTAPWRTTRPFWCLDLADETMVPSLFDMTARESRPWLRFLAQFARAIASPIPTKSTRSFPEQPAVAYVPTQIVTEYVRDVFHVPDSAARIEGIRYRSSVADGFCWVLFSAKSDDCSDLVAMDEHRVVTTEPKPALVADWN